MCNLNSGFTFAGFNALVLAEGYTEFIRDLLGCQVGTGTHGFEADGLDIRILFGLAMIITESERALQLDSIGSPIFR